MAKSTTLVENGRLRATNDNAPAREAGHGQELRDRTVTLRAALYDRYSSHLQRAAPIEDRDGR